MKHCHQPWIAIFSVCLVFSGVATVTAADTEPSAPAQQGAGIIDGTEPGWRPLTEEDFTRVNCADETFVWDGNNVHCTGEPVGVLRTKQPLKNFELVGYWRHLRPAGNSGFFAWVSDEALEGLKPNALPKGGIEIQILDLGYAEQYQQRTGKRGDWFTTHGDVFAVGTSQMKPFPPLSPDGSRSFPTEQRTLGAGEWNHYYVRCINGEVRLWVNGREVSGGADCQPASGYLCLESEGSPIDFRDLKVRELP